MDSGFNVATGILTLHDVRVHGQSLIKNIGKFLLKDIKIGLKLTKNALTERIFEALPER